MRIFGGFFRRVTSCTIEDQEAIRPGPAGGWHAAKLRLTHVSFPLGFIALVRKGFPDPAVRPTGGFPGDAPTVGDSFGEDLLDPPFG